MPILQGVEDSVTNTNFKYFGELGLHQVSLQREEAIAHWGAMNKAREGFMTRALRDFAQNDPSEAMADRQVLSSSVPQDGINATIVASLAQILAKISNNTPPQSGVEK